MKKFKQKLIKFICFLLFIIIFVCVIYIFDYHYDNYLAKKESILLNNFLDDETEAPYNVQNENPIIENTAKIEYPIIEKTERMLKLENLQLENPDIVGIIEIENTDINYPVVQGTDNTYYINHNYKKQKSKNGSIFLDKDYSWNPPSSNLLIYGHNMKNNTMFQGLLKYKSKSFYEQHPNIRFTTNNEDAIYEIFSVFESRVYYKSEENVFRYYYFINANNQYEYNQFVENAKKSSLYNIDKKAEFGEQLMTLSTCSYHTKDGRFVVVAKHAQ